jgi:ArsR family transcriptional regulator
MKTTAAPLSRSTRLFRAFADPVRLRLLNLLGDGREVCVCHLHEALGLPQPTVSRHLAYLRRSGLVVGRKEGLWVYYRLAKPTSALPRKLLGCLPSCTAEAEVFQRDAERLRHLASRCEGP